MVLDRLYQQVFFACAVALVASIGTWKVQDWRYGAKETERAENNLELERLASKERTRRDTAVIQAQGRAAQRANLARGDADLARDAADRLLSDADKSIVDARVSHQACVVHATALKDVLQGCTGAYREVATKADGHANDARTLSESWPE